MVIKTLRNLSVPEQTDCLFTSPDFKSWRSLQEENKGLLAGVNNRNISQCELLKITTEYTHQIGSLMPHLNNTADIIVTGHQPNWHHCGILAKNIVTDRFARQTGGTAIHLVLDHDICDTSMMRPEYAGNGSVWFKTIPLEQKQQDVPLEFRPVPPKEQLTIFIESILRIENSFCSEIGYQNLHSIIEKVPSCTGIADFITRLQAYLNQVLGIEIFYLPVSRMSQSNCFADFVYPIICNAAGFVKSYNQAILNQRESYKLRPNQAVRPLKINSCNNVFELPFWLVSNTGERASLYVSVNGKTLQVGTEHLAAGTIDLSGDKKEQLLEILEERKCVIRPKAVTLMLFVRLYLADWFVHGVGAGNYEYITDHLIRHYYEISGLNFGIATATMILPTNINNQNPQITEADIQKKNKLQKEATNYREYFFGLFPKQRLATITKTEDMKI
jgi:hypothetical protein